MCTNCIDSPPCWHKLGIQYTDIENVDPCTRVCTSGTVCPGVVQKQPHSSRGCRPQCFPSHHNRVLRPAQVDQHPVLAEIAPPYLRREAATLVSGRRACQHDHLLHDVIENSTHRKRFKSRRPLTHHAHQLESWASTTTRLHKYMPTPSNSGQGVGLSRRAWTRLNRLRTGVGRFGANMLRWGLSTSDCCDCGAEQTAEHITSGRCPIYRPPEGIHGLTELDVMTRTWLENCSLDV